MKALVTGITGFAGSHLAEHLLAEGDSVLGVSRRGLWPPGTPADSRASIPLLAWDLAGRRGPPDTVLQSVRSFAPDVIYHLGAVSVPADCENTPDRPNAEADAAAVNVEGTRQVLQLAARIHPAPRVAHISSSQVYASVASDSPKVKEDYPLQPANAYGRTKLAAEEALRDAARELRLDTIIVRAFQHLGPRQGPDMMLSQWCRQLARSGTEPITVYNCSTFLDVTDVRDVVRAYRLLACHGESGGVYNVGSGTRGQTGDILRMLARAAAQERQIIEQQPGIRHNPIADIARLVERTSWRPEIPIERTLADTLAWWQCSPHAPHEDSSCGA